MDEDNTDNDTDNIQPDPNIIFWLLFSTVSSMVFARYSKGMCTYLFLSFSWIYIWLIFTQSWSVMERSPHDIALIAAASLLGWLIGTLIVWRKKSWGACFFEN